MDKTQRALFIVLPFVFVPFILNFPTGLMLYWVTTNLWTVGQGVITRRLLPKPAPAPAKRTSRTPAQAPAPGDGDGAQPAKGEAAKTASPQGQRRVRRRKKRGPQARR